MNQSEIAQMVLENQDAIRQGVGRITTKASLAADIHADLVSDANLVILEKRGKSFDPSRASAAVFCRMVAFQVALDKLRAMKRGGQFSGAYAGFGNLQLDRKGPQEQPSKKEMEAQGDLDSNHIGVDRIFNLMERGMIAAESNEELAENAVEPAKESRWMAGAHKALAEVLPLLSDADMKLWSLMASGSFDAEAYSAKEGIAVATAYVRANRLRAKLRKLLAKAA